jgi:hypothetical protein
LERDCAQRLAWADAADASNTTNEAAAMRASTRGGRGERQVAGGRPDGLLVVGFSIDQST